MKTLVVIDANSLINRTYYALPPFTNSKGEPTGALYGLANILLKMFNEREIDYVMACFDRPEELIRKQVYKDYKAQRGKADDELVAQLIRAKDLFRVFGVKSFEMAGYEADDLIGTAVKKFVSHDLRVIILTGDLDATQLVNDAENIVVESFKKGISEIVLYDESEVFKKFGVRPDQITDYKGLVGDLSDNIKGVPGVGPKTAQALINEFQSIERIYENMTDDKKFNKVRDFKEEAISSKKLATIDGDVPISLGKLDDLKPSKIPNKELIEFASELGFNSLLNRMGATQNNEEEKDLEDEEEMDISKVDFIVSKKDFKKNNNLKVGFDLKKKAWQGLGGPYFDLGIAFWLIDSDVQNYSPEYAFKRFLKKDLEENEESLKKAYVFTLNKLKSNNLWHVFNDIEMPLLPVLAEMEEEGIYVNQKKLKELTEETKKIVLKIEKDIYKISGVNFNIRSPKQLGDVLFKDLGISVKKIKKTSGGSYSTNYDNLIKIKDEHAVIPLVLEYREIFKVLSTYLEPTLEFLRIDERLHTTYVQTGSATGRLSSENPNLQNIPQGTKLSKKFRETFEASKGKVFLAFDYSQMELRILASVANDKKMIEAFREGRDIHTETASHIFKVEPDKVDREMRRMAKVLNFGIVYGMGSMAYAQSAGISRAEAKKHIEDYFIEFKAIKKWHEYVKHEAKTLGYVETLNGRRRLLPEITSNSQFVVAQAERIAINMPIQGLAADILKMAMIETANVLKKKKLWREEVSMLLTIHDELLFEVKEEKKEKVIDLIKNVMEKVFTMQVPLKVEVKEGKNWGEI